MKQHIIENQWNKLSQESKTKFCDAFEEINEYPLLVEPNIGQLIQFLGDNFHKLHRHTDDQKWTAKKGGQWCVSIKPKPNKLFWAKEPVDCLWEAVKYKLTN